MPSVHSFIEDFKRKFSRLDILINNAAQTIRRPRAYYRPLVDFESLAASGKLPAAQSWASMVASSSSQSSSANSLMTIDGHSTTLIPAFASSAPLSAALTQVPLLPADEVERDEKSFPPNVFDEHGEPADLRSATSWTARLGELSPLETMEAHIVNAVVPLVLVQSLLPLLTSGSRGDAASFIVNVSSPEGLFDPSLNKAATHVHTNMSKAALNMMVRTLASQLARQQVFLSAVDTGWITRMRPVTNAKWHDFYTGVAPLSDKDGAARVLDPVAMGYIGMSAPYGVMLRNYNVVQW